jgi:hypothetical protein
MNWKEFGGKRSWRNRGTFLKIFQRGWGKPWDISVSIADMSGPWFGTSSTRPPHKPAKSHSMIWADSSWILLKMIHSSILGPTLAIVTCLYANSTIVPRNRPWPLLVSRQLTVHNHAVPSFGVRSPIQQAAAAHPLVLEGKILTVMKRNFVVHVIIWGVGRTYRNANVVSRVDVANWIKILLYHTWPHLTFFLTELVSTIWIQSDCGILGCSAV